MTKIISIVNTKGGVGKTVTAVHLGAALAGAGCPTLLIDIDLQHGLTSYFNLDPDSGTTSDVLLGATTLGAASVKVRPGLWVVPATAEMERTEVELAGLPGGELRLRRALRQAKETLDLFAYCLIDCPSGWGAATRNALLASSSIIIPINSEPAAVTNALTTDQGRQELTEYHEHDIGLAGVLLTRWRGARTAKSVATQVNRAWGDNVFQTRIRQAEKLNDLAVSGKTLTDLSTARAGSIGADYQSLAREVMARCPA